MAAPININANLNLNPASINASARQVQQALGRITGQASEFQKSLDASTARVFAFGATTAIINGVNQSFKALVSTTINVQAKLTEINSILGASNAEFNKYRNSIFEVAKSTGQSFNTVAEGAAELARQGLGATESARRLQAALILTRISGLGAEQSVKALTAAMNGFTSAGLTAEQVVNKIVAVDTAFAVSAQDLAEGFSRAGSTAEDAGVSFDELLGLITAVEQRTARGGAVIGNAFKSIFTRVSRGSTIDKLKDLGVAIDANQSGVQKLKALSDALQSVSDPTVASQIKELAGGVFQINVVSAALKDIGSDASVFAEATKTGMNAANEATEKNNVLNTTLLANLNKLTVTATSLGEKLGNLTLGPILENVVGLATSLAEGLDKALDPERGNKFIQGLFKIIGGFLSGPGLAIFTIAFVKIFKTVTKFAKEGFSTVMKMGTAAEKISQIEGGLISLLQKDAALRKTLESTTASQATKEQAVIDAIRRENALLSAQQQIVTNIANIARQGGVTGYSTSSGSFKGKGGKRFASGGNGIMEPDLMTAMVNESRDAPAGASPYVTNFRGSPAVMNTSEMQVNIGGREEILTAGQIPRFAGTSVKGGKTRKKRATNKEIGNKYVMLTPKIDEDGTFGPMTVNKKKHNFVHPIAGMRSKQLKTISDKSEDTLESRIKKMMFKEASEWTGRIQPLNRSAPVAEIKKGFDSTGGAKGALHAAIGSAFEVGIKKSLGYESRERDAGGDFDVRGGRNLKLIQKLFGISQNIGDMKNSSESRGNRESFVKKVRNERKAGAFDADEADAQKRNRVAAALKKQRISLADKGPRALAIRRRIGRQTASSMGATNRLSKGTISNSRLASRIGIRRFNSGSMDRNKVFNFGLANQSGPSLQKISNDAASQISQAKSSSDLTQAYREQRKEVTKLAKAQGLTKEATKDLIKSERQNATQKGRIISGNVKGASPSSSHKSFRMTGGGGRMGSSIKSAMGNQFGAGMGLSMLGGGLDLAANELNEAGMEAAAKYTKAAGTVLQFAATGAMIGGPVGAAIGGLAGLGYSIYDNVQQAERDAQAIEDARVTKSNAEAGGRFVKNFGTFSEYGSVGGIDNALSSFSGRSGMTGGGAAPIIDAVQKQMMDSARKLDGMSKNDDGYFKARDKFNADATRAINLLKDRDMILKLDDTLGEKKRQMEALVNEGVGATFANQMQGAVTTSARRGSLLGSVGGDLSGILQADNAVSQNVAATGLAKANYLSGQESLRATEDPEKRAEIEKKLSAAKAKLDSSREQTAIALTKRRMEIEKQITEVAKERASLETKVTSDRISSISKSVKEGPIDLSIIKDFRGKFAKAGSDDDQRNLITELKGTLLDKGANGKMIAVLTKMAGIGVSGQKGGVIGAGKLESLSLGGRFEGTEGFGGKILEELYSTTNAEQGQEKITDLGTKEKALNVSLGKAQERIEGFAKSFNAEGVLANLDAMATSLKDAGTNIDAFKIASDGIASLAIKTNRLSAAAGKKIDENLKAITDLKGELGDIRGQVQDAASL